MYNSGLKNNNYYSNHYHHQHQQNLAMVVTKSMNRIMDKQLHYTSSFSYYYLASRYNIVVGHILREIKLNYGIDNDDCLVIYISMIFIVTGIIQLIRYII